jgi:hypothetical protein
MSTWLVQPLRALLMYTKRCAFAASSSDVYHTQRVVSLQLLVLMFTSFRLSNHVECTNGPIYYALTIYSGCKSVYSELLSQLSVRYTWCSNSMILQHELHCSAVLMPSH